jgi:hypothetical protein
MDKREEGKGVAPECPQSGGHGGPDHVPTLGEMLFWPVKKIARLDLAFKNLLCATDLPDTGELDIPSCMAKLADWTECVKRETESNLYRFRGNPSKYHGSEAFWRAAMIVTVLQQDIGVRYDQDCRNTSKFLDSREGFIHGLLQGKGGTCANMPVLYAAVGRRLGYAMYLANAKGHIFCRWASKDGRERFNIEGSGRGMNMFTDEYYMEWPRKVTDREVGLNPVRHSDCTVMGWRE